MFLEVKNSIKSKFPVVFSVLRKILKKPYSYIYKNKLLAFKNRQLHDFSYHGHDFKIVIDPANGTVDEQIFLYGVYEPNILDLYMEELSAGDTYIDIGANIGQHALFAASVVGKNGLVRAFEPIPRLYKQIIESAEKSGFSYMQIVPKAIGLIDEQKNIYKTNKNIGGSSLIESANHTETETIEVASGAEQLSDLEKIDFIKIDTEGYEMIVLESLLPIIQKHHPKIIFEYNPELYQPAQLVALKKIQDLGYSFIDYHVNKRNPIVDITSWQLPKNRKQADILCLPKNPAKSL